MRHVPAGPQFPASAGDLSGSQDFSWCAVVREDGGTTIIRVRAGSDLEAAFMAGRGFSPAAELVSLEKA